MPADLRNSTIAFQDFQHEREAGLSRSAELLSNLPSLKALMTTQDAITIQDTSTDFWRLVGSDLFVLTDRTGKIVALHTSTSGFTVQLAQASVQRSLQSGQPKQWWFGADHLYEVFLQPIYLGPERADNSLGLLAVGFEIDSDVAQKVRRVSTSDVAFRYGDSIVVSTFPRSQEAELARQLKRRSPQNVQDIQLDTDRYLATSLDLAPDNDKAAPVVELGVFKSYDQAARFLNRIYRFLLGLGLVAVLCEGLLVFLISRRFTQPLEALVGGVRALEKGDFSYPLEPRGIDEVAEVTVAFDRMRGNLRKTQQQLLDSERLATIGRMASSISHDLRHQLTAIVANSEFLSEPKFDPEQREDLYQEIRLAVNQMTDLIDSLLEFSRTKDSLCITLGSIEEVMKHAIRAVGAHREFQDVSVTLTCEGSSESWFDARKMERAFYNLLLNACQAVAQHSGKVVVSIRNKQDHLDILVIDDGPGVPPPIRDRLFEPFVSYGKENGTGLGLTIVRKIIEDHGGRVAAERTGAARTVFTIALPVSFSAGIGPARSEASAISSPVRP